MTQTNVRKFPRAMVLGAGICGLATATALGRHFEQVTVIEQDRFSDAPAPRLHAPQGAHIHILLAGGLLTLTRLAPRLPSLLDDLGVQSGDLTEHTRVSYNGRWLPRVHSGIPIRVCTRGDVEQALLRDAKTRPQITLRDGTRLLGFVYFLAVLPRGYSASCRRDRRACCKPHSPTFRRTSRSCAWRTCCRHQQRY